MDGLCKIAREERRERKKNKKRLRRMDIQAVQGRVIRSMLYANTDIVLRNNDG